MKTIRNKSLNGKVWYSAKDVYSRLGLNWDGVMKARYTRDIDYGNFSSITLPKKNGNKTIEAVQYALNVEGIKQLCNAAKVNYNKKFADIAVVKPQDVDQMAKELRSLEKTVDDLKVLLSQSLIAANFTKKELKLATTSVKLTNDPLQYQARVKIRELVNEYAERRADQMGIIDPEKRRIFYDLTYKALYNKYKELTKNKTDLKKLAEEKTRLTGNKVSALQIAEQTGVAVDLLHLAENLFNS